MKAHARLATTVALGSILGSINANPLKDHYFPHLYGRQDSVGGCLADDQCSCEGPGALCNLDMSWALDPSLASILGSDNSTTTDPPPDPTTTTPATTPSQTDTPTQSTDLCVGNQVQGDCKAGSLPSAPPFSGPQPPSCVKADGSPGAAARINEQKLLDAASEYCNNLVNGKVVLSEGGSNPKPGIVSDAAEGGKSLALVTMYYQTSCPTDKSSSTLDFGTYGVQKCVDAFSTYIAQTCAQDSTWTNFNKDFTIMGGTLGMDCGLFSVYSQ